MRSKNFGLPSSPLLFGEEIVAGLGQQGLGCYQVVAFGGPHKTLFGDELFLPSGCKTLHAEKEKLPLPKKKTSFFVNSFPGSLVEPQVAKH